MPFSEIIVKVSCDLITTDSVCLKKKKICMDQNWNRHVRPFKDREFVICQKPAIFSFFLQGYVREMFVTFFQQIFILSSFDIRLQ